MIDPNDIPINERLRLVDEVLSSPYSPFPPGSLSTEQKLVFFEKLLKDGVIKFSTPKPHIQTPQKSTNLTFADLADSLTPQQVDRLMEIKAAYPYASIEELPPDSQKEFLEILEIAKMNAKAGWKNSENPNSEVSFSEIETNIPPDKKRRLDEIYRQYPNVLHNRLPYAIQKEEEEIYLEAKRRALEARERKKQDSEIERMNNESKLPAILGTNNETKEPLYIEQKIRDKGVYIIGVSGMGKSTLIQNLAHDDLKKGYGVCVLDPHRDLVDDIVAQMPKNRVNDVVLLDITDKEYSFGLNLFECDNPKYRESAISFVYKVFNKIWNVDLGNSPRLTEVLRHCTPTLIANQGLTMDEIPLLFNNATFRNQAIKKLRRIEDSHTIAFWKEYEEKSDSAKRQYKESTLNKFDAFYSTPSVRNIIAQSKTTINFKAIVERKKILLVKFDKKLPDATNLLGAAIIGKLIEACEAQGEKKREDRVPFRIYLDEFHRYTPDVDIESITNEGRKYGIHATYSHQNFTQLSESVKEIVLNSGTKISFRVSITDASLIAKLFTKLGFSQKELEQEATPGDAINFLVRRGHTDERVASFTQRYLLKLDEFIRNQRDPDGVVTAFFLLPKELFSEARNKLNEILFSTMKQGESNITIPPVVLFAICLSQEDRSEISLIPYLKYDVHEDRSPFVPHDFSGLTNLIKNSPFGTRKGKLSIEKVAVSSRSFFGFKDTFIFGEPDFIVSGKLERWLNIQLKANNESSSIDFNNPFALFASHLAQLRATLEVLAKNPTGKSNQEQQKATHSEIENELAKLEEYRARVLMGHQEFAIKTEKPPLAIYGDMLEKQKEDISKQMQSPNPYGYVRKIDVINKEIALRQKNYTSGDDNLPPPSQSY